MIDDQDFQKFVCQSLQEIRDAQTDMDERLTKHIDATQGMIEIVTMGETMFKMANWVGKGIQVIAYIAASAGMLWAAVHQYFKGFGK